MYNKRNKILLSTVFCGSITCTYADYENTNTKTDKSQHVITISTPDAPKAIELPSARPQVNDGFDIFLVGNWILWQPNTAGLAYVVEQQSKSKPKVTQRISNGTVKNLHFDYSSGFEIGLGVNLSHDGWDAIASWTCFIDSTSHTTDNNNGEYFLFTTFISPRGNAVVDEILAVTQKAHAKWKLYFNMLDLEMGREFFGGKWLKLRPFFGLRGAWIKQKYEINYYNVGYLFDQANTVFNNYEADNTNKYFGFGPRVGIDADWGFGSGLSLYANAGIALLYGFFHLNTSENGYNDLIGNNPLQKNMDNSYKNTKPVTDIEIGLKWDYYFLNDALHLSLHGGWQQVLFFSQNQIMRSSNGYELGQFLQNQGDLAFMGWSFGGRFDF